MTESKETSTFGDILLSKGIGDKALAKYKAGVEEDKTLDKPEEETARKIIFEELKSIMMSVPPHMKCEREDFLDQKNNRSPWNVFFNSISGRRSVSTIDATTIPLTLTLDLSGLGNDYLKEQLKIIEDIAMRFQELDINISLITITSDGTIGDQTPYYPTDPKSKLAAAAIGSDKISVKDVDDLIPGNGFVLYGGRGRTFYLLSIYEDKYSFYDSTHQELIVYSKEELKKYIEEKKIHLFKQYTTTVLIKDRINKEAEESYSSDNSSNSRSRHY